MDCDISCIILSGVTERSVSTRRVLAILLKVAELMPAEAVIHCVHLRRPVLMVKPPNLKLLKGGFSESNQTGGSTCTALSRLTALQLARNLCASLMYDVWTLPVT